MPFNKLIFISIMSCSLSTNGQYIHNLVPNYSFETHLSCKPEIISTAVPWQSPTSLKNYSAEYANSCDTNKCCGVPVNVNGFNYQMARTGEAYVGLYFMFEFGWNVRNYAQVKLNDSLVAGKCYYTEFFVVLTDDGEFGVNNIGLLFSKTAVHQPGQGHVIIANPQILNFGNPVIKDTMNWTKVSGIFTAQGGEKYITIGNFKSDSNTDTIHTNFPIAGHAGGYFLDDVSVVPVDSMKIKAEAGRDTSISLGDTVFIGTILGGQINTSWYNSMGQLIASNVPGLKVSPNQTTFYVLVQNFCGRLRRDTIRVFVNTLPLSLLNLSAKKQADNVWLSWKTANEENTSHFIIQRSTNSISYTNVGRVQAAGNSNIVQSYSYVDAAILSANRQLSTANSIYYRLQMVDKDGKFNYSPIEKIRLTNTERLKVFPNPAKDKVYVVGTGITSILLSDLSGRALISQQLSSVATAVFNVSELCKGVYVLQVTNDKGKLECRKVVVGW